MTQAEFEDRIIAMQDTLYRVSATILKQQCDREDAIQECICKALRKREKLRDDRALRAWAVRILINECYILLRRRKRETPMDCLPEAEVMPDADLNVHRLLFSMEEKFRLPMVLFYVEGYQINEIARMLLLPMGTVKSRLSRGREHLRRAIKQEEVCRV